MGVATVLARRVALVITEMVGDLALRGGLQQPLGQLLQQPPSPISCRPSAWDWPSNSVDHLVATVFADAAFVGSAVSDTFSLVIDASS
jgi:hypothetical protein